MPRTGLMQRKGVEGLHDLDVLTVRCPAGALLHETSQGPAVNCRLEGSVISVAADVTSFAAYCCGMNELCPTWREARHIEEAGGNPMTMTAPRGEERTYDVEELQEIDEIEASGHFEDADARRGELIERKRERGLAPGLEG